MAGKTIRKRESIKPVTEFDYVFNAERFHYMWADGFILPEVGGGGTAIIGA
ncbi:MAG: hypothetical protein ACM3WV_02735 [Bacillota bacterium]